MLNFGELVVLELAQCWIAPMYAKNAYITHLATKITWCTRAKSWGSNACKIVQMAQIIVEIWLAEVEMHILMDWPVNTSKPSAIPYS
jgi:hypothetical protein